MANERSSKSRRPLKPIEVYLLLALVDGPAHGYVLAERIQQESGGRIELLPGNLYAILRRVEAAGLVQQAPRLPAPDEDQRRRYYRLTDRGRTVLAEEGRRMALLGERVARSLSVVGEDG